MALVVLFQAALELTGIVVNPQGRPLPNARVEVGAMVAHTNAQGRFNLTFPPGSGLQNIRVACPSFSPAELAVQPGTDLRIQLELPVASATVQVTEGAIHDSQAGRSATVARIDVYRTPGGMADVFHAIKALAGISLATEGAELYVRGGNPVEVSVQVNGALMARPFHHESAQGGILSVMDTSLVSRMTFMPGGFSARYGDALSAVLEFSTETDAQPSGNQISASLSSLGFQTTQALGGRLVSPNLLRLSLREVDTRPVASTQAVSGDYATPPQSLDANLAYQSEDRSWQIVAIAAQDHLGLRTRYGALAGVYDNRSETGFFSLSHLLAVGEGSLEFAGSLNHYRHKWSFGPWGIDSMEQRGHVRAQWNFSFLPGVETALGLELDRLAWEPRGSKPEDPLRWESNAGSVAFGNSPQTRSRLGVYAIQKHRFSDSWGLAFGIRGDRYGEQGTADLRATLSWAVDRQSTWRLALGSFHQAAETEFLDPNAGNPDLKVQRALHVVLSFEKIQEWEEALLTFRAETYQKSYANLPVKDPAKHYVSDGYGNARGLDLFLKASHRGLRSTLSYSLLLTKRKEGVQRELGTVPTSIPHSATFTGGFFADSGWDYSCAFRFASGTPITPITGAVDQPTVGWVPVAGDPFSDRLPAYGRLDFRVTRPWIQSGIRWFGFAEVINLLGRKNSQRASYSEDYRTRILEPSYFARPIIVVGISAAW